MKFPVHILRKASLENQILPSYLVCMRHREKQRIVYKMSLCKCMAEEAFEKNNRKSNTAKGCKGRDVVEYHDYILQGYGTQKKGYLRGINVDRSVRNRVGIELTELICTTKFLSD